MFQYTTKLGRQLYSGCGRRLLSKYLDVSSRRAIHRGSTGLTSWDTAADVHGCHPGSDLGGSGLIDITLLGSLAGAGSGGGVVVDNDTDTRALGASSELHLGSLDEGGLGEGERTVEAGKVTLLLGGGVFAGGNLLA